MRRYSRARRASRNSGKSDSDFITYKSANTGRVVIHDNDNKGLEVLDTFFLLDTCIPHMDRVYTDRIGNRLAPVDPMDSWDCNCRYSRMDQRSNADLDREFAHGTVEVQHSTFDHLDNHYRIRYTSDSDWSHLSFRANNPDSYLVSQQGQVVTMDPARIQ